MRKTVLLTIIAIILLCSCAFNPGKDEGGDDEADVSPSMQMVAEDISSLTSVSFKTESSASGFSAATDSSSGISSRSYLSFASSDNTFQPLVFQTEDEDMLVFSSSSECQLLPVGNHSFLCVFDTLVVVDSIPLFADGKLSIDIVRTVVGDNIAYMDTDTGKTYILNNPMNPEGPESLDFSVFSSADGSYGYSDNRIFLFSDDGVLWTMLKDNPDAGMTAVNNSKDKLPMDVTLYTDDYVIIQDDVEDNDKEEVKSYLKVYDTTGEDIHLEQEITRDDSLSSTIFRVGNNLFTRNFDISNNSYSFVISKVVIDMEKGEVRTEEAETFQIAESVTSYNYGSNKNSSFSVFHDGYTELIRAENRFKIIVRALVDGNGDITDKTYLDLNDDSWFPFPISGAFHTDSALYWIRPGKVYKADFSAGNIETIEIEGILEDSGVFVTEEGDIIYNASLTGNIVGTYIYDTETGKSTLISSDAMDVHHIYRV